jgi:hypothetical protein
MTRASPASVAIAARHNALTMPLADALSVLCPARVIL